MAKLKLAQTKKLINQANTANLPLEFHLKTVTINGENNGCSGFVRNPSNDKIVYLTTDCMTVQSTGTNSGYRIMFRTARHLKDYTGGHNQWTTPDQLGKKIMPLLT